MEREARHAGRRTVGLTRSHAEAGRHQRLLTEVSLSLSGLRNRAEPLSARQGGERIGEQILPHLRIWKAPSRADLGHGRGYRGSRGRWKLKFCTAPGCGSPWCVPPLPLQLSLSGLTAAVICLTVCFDDLSSGPKLSEATRGRQQNRAPLARRFTRRAVALE